MSNIIPYLICDKFQSNLYLEFENIDINCSSTKLFRLQNPNTKLSINISHMKKLSNEQKGFNITFDNNQLSDHTIIAPSSEVIGQVTWTPKQNMSVREIIILKVDDKISLQIIVSGKCGVDEVCVLQIAYIIPLVYNLFLYYLYLYVNLYRQTIRLLDQTEKLS